MHIYVCVCACVRAAVHLKVKAFVCPPSSPPSLYELTAWIRSQDWDQVLFRFVFFSKGMVVEGGGGWRRGEQATGVGELLAAATKFFGALFICKFVMLPSLLLLFFLLLYSWFHFSIAQHRIQHTHTLTHADRHTHSDCLHCTLESSLSHAQQMHSNWVCNCAAAAATPFKTAAASAFSIHNVCCPKLTHTRTQLQTRSHTHTTAKREPHFISTSILFQ